MKLFFIPFIVLFFASCECYQVVSGTIIDSDSDKPVAKVNVTAPKSGEVVQTDSTGRFEINTTAKSLLKCPDLKLLFEADGYKVRALEFPSGTETHVQLKKE